MQTDAFSNDSSDNPVSLLVGEGKKFKSVEDLAKGKLEADRFIESLLREKAELLETLNKKQTEDQVQKSLQTAQETTQTSTTARVSEEPKDLKALVQQTVQNLFAEQEIQSNVTKVNNRLSELFGEKAPERVAQRANELGVGVDFLKSVAAKSPEAFYKLLDTGTAAPTGSVTQSTVTTPQTVGDTKTTKSWDDYSAMRKSNPSLYFSPQMQKEIFEAVRDGKLVLPK